MQHPMKVEEATHESRTAALIGTKQRLTLSQQTQIAEDCDAPIVGPLSAMSLFINETRLDSCGAAISCRDVAPGDASMMVYGGTPPEMDICQESQGSTRVTFVVIVGATANTGSAGRQSEDPAAKISQCVSMDLEEKRPTCNHEDCREHPT